MTFTPTDEQEAARDLFRDEEDNIAIEALAGCLAAGTVLHLNRGGKGFRYRIEDLVSRCAGLEPRFERTVNGRSVRQRLGRAWADTIPTRIARADGNTVRLGTVDEAWCSGEKDTYEMTTESGRKVRATALHPFLTDDGWAVLGDLAVGSKVTVNLGRGSAGRGPKRQYRYRATRHHPHQVANEAAGRSWKVAEHRLVIEADLNGIGLDDYLRALRSDPERAAGFRYLDPAVHVHHRDEDPLHNALSNLRVMEPGEHHRQHAAEGGGDSVLWRVGLDVVASIRPHGPEMTYDVAVADAPHNFIANGFVVHNTGKTSTLRFIAREFPHLRFQYVAFNKAIVTDAQNSMPPNVDARTAHSLAFRAVGHAYRHRLNSKRMRSAEIADRLGILYGYDVTFGTQRKPLARGYLASHVMRAALRFCQSADPEPTVRHFPYIEGIDLPNGSRRTYTNNNAIAVELLPALRRAWADLASPDGVLKYDHGHYLKVWQLGNPKIDADVILFDEAQDANPVLLDIVERQEQAQRVWVGDSRQAIYEWNGAVDALAKIDASARSALTLSFRFGPPIADHANRILARLGERLKIRGHPDVESTVGAHDAHTAILSRTNARAMRHVLGAQEAGLSPHLVGGGKETAAFARGARQLQDEGWSSHPDLACFSDWGEVTDYVAFDPSGSELALNYKLVEEFGVDTILKALAHMTPERDASVIVSTAHKAKGREWPTVLISDDFAAKIKAEASAEELRLLYVATTRARHGLDDRHIRECLAEHEPGRLSEGDA